MSHTVRLEDHIHEKLENFRDKRETYSQAVERLLAASDRVSELINILEGQAEFEKWKQGILENLDAGKVLPGAH